MTTKAELLKGVIKFFNYEKGYGFVIDTMSAKEFFFHVTDIADNNKVLQKDEDVFFSLTEGKKGVKAINVKRQ
jgi:CspA family cold shock protein